MSVLTPNMGLVLPTIGVDSGLVWETSVNADFQKLDGHNHTPGYGSAISAAGINLQSDLPFNNNNASFLKSILFQSQLAPIAAVAPYLNSLYVAAGDLYFNDGAGDTPIQITASGAVKVTFGSMTGSGGASASFSAGTLIVNAASLTPANIQAASILLGNNVANSKYLTLAPPATMVANYGLILPPLPAANAFLTLDPATNAITGSVPVAGGITSSMIAAGTITGTNISSTGTITGSMIAGGTVTQNNRATAIAGVSSLINYSFTTGDPYTLAPGSQVTLTTTGRPLVLCLCPAANPSAGYSNGNGNGFLVFAIDGSTLATFALSSNSDYDRIFTQVVLPPYGAGAHTFAVYVKMVSGTFYEIINLNLAVCEL